MEQTCYCALAAKWWRPASNVTHADYFCRATGRTAPYLEPDQIRAGVIFGDGSAGFRAFPSMDGTALVPWYRQ